MELPQSSNVFGQSKGPLSKAEIAEAFSRSGWECRKCAWHDHEIRNDYSELVIDGEDHDNLIHGVVSDPQINIPHISRILTDLGLQWSFEIQDLSGDQVAYFSS